MTWLTILTKLREFDVKYLDTPVIIGGGDSCLNFYGFSVNRSTTPLTLRNLIFSLSMLPMDILRSEVDNKAEFISDKFGIGLNKAYISHSNWVDENTGETTDFYFPLQDYLGKEFGVDKSLDEVLKEFEEESRMYRACYSMPDKHDLLPEDSLIVIETRDGSCILDDEDVFYGNSL